MFRLRNRGDAPATNIEYQVAELVGNFTPRIAQDSVDTTVGAGDVLIGNPFIGVLPYPIDNHLFRIWLRYRNLSDPHGKPLVQTIFRVWTGNVGGHPSPVFSLLSGDIKGTEDYFNKEVPFPK